MDVAGCSRDHMVYSKQWVLRVSLYQLTARDKKVAFLSFRIKAP